MNHLRSLVRAGTVALIAAGGAQSSASAQPLQATAPVKVSQSFQTEARAIRVRNVRSNLMAWWLDPVRNVEPVEVVSARHAAKRSGPTALKLLPSEFQGDIYAAAKGLISFTSIDSQNVLIAHGSAEGIRRFEEIVQELDKPIPELEISAQFVEISPADADTLNIEFLAAPENVTAEGKQASKQRIGVVRGDIQARLDALVQQNKARIINSPRVTTMNNLSARLISMMASPAVLGVKDETGQFNPVFDSTQDTVPSRLFVGVAIGLGVTPSIHGDGTITLDIGPFKTLHVVVENKEDVVPGSAFDNSLFLKNLEGQNTTVKARDGETIVLTGAGWPSSLSDMANDKMTAQQSSANMLYLVTPRILRRPGPLQ